MQPELNIIPNGFPLFFANTWRLTYKGYNYFKSVQEPYICEISNKLLNRQIAQLSKIKKPYYIHSKGNNISIFSDTVAVYLKLNGDDLGSYLDVLQPV